MIDIQTELQKILEDEITRATEKHGRLNSGHEACGALKEEIEEADIEIHSMKEFYGYFWNAFRRVKVINCDYLNEVRDNAIRAAAELVQVAAVAERLRRQEGGE